jgi:DNA-binding PadR family transcriptional regulator
MAEQSGKWRLTEEQQKLLPLTPAVFFILFALADDDKHGYAIMQRVVRLSDGEFQMGPGTLYTTIQRLLDLQLIEEVLSANEADTRRRYYRLGRAGKALLDAELDRMHRVLKTASRMKLATEGSGQT